LETLNNSLATIDQKLKTDTKNVASQLSQQQQAQAQAAQLVAGYD
jgi:hypothetical protein